MVKDSRLEIDPIEPTVLIINHVLTDIVFYDMVNNSMEIIGSLSPTSNRMIRAAINFFNPSIIVDLNENCRLYPKNSFSQPLEL